MSSKFGKKFHDLIFEEVRSKESSGNEEDNYTVAPANSANVAVAPPAKQNMNSNITIEASPVIYASTASGIDPKFDAQIRQVIKDHDEPGPTFFKYSEAVRNLRNSIHLDEEAAIKSAFEVLKGTGLTREIIASSAKDNLAMLQDEITHFENTVKDKLKEKVEAPQKDINELVLENKGIEKQISDLNTQLRQNNNVINTKNEEVENEKMNIEKKRKLFQNTINAIIVETKDISNKAAKIL